MSGEMIPASRVMPGAFGSDAATSRTSLRRAGALALALALAACGDSDPVGVGETGLEPGTFEATVSGDMSLNYQGTAVFQTVNAPEQELFAHVLQIVPAAEASADVGWLLLATESPQPPEGTFPVVAITEQELDQAPAGFLPPRLTEGFVYLGFFGEPEQWAALVLSEVGEVVVSATDDGGIEGRFQAAVQGRILDAGGETGEELQLEISGEFNAVPGAVDIL